MERDPDANQEDERQVAEQRRDRIPRRHELEGLRGRPQQQNGGKKSRTASHDHHEQKLSAGSGGALELPREPDDELSAGMVGHLKILRVLSAPVPGPNDAPGV